MTNEEFNQLIITLYETEKYSMMDIYHFLEFNDLLTYYKDIRKILKEHGVKIRNHRNQMNDPIEGKTRPLKSYADYLAEAKARTLKI